MTNGIAFETNGIASPIPCPYCGCEMRAEAYTYLGLWFRVVPTENHGKGCFLRGVQHRRFCSKESAIASWNTRAAVTDHDFAMAVHDGNLWGKCSECKERKGYYLDAETIQRQQEHIAELQRENEEVLEAWANQAATIKAQIDGLHARDELIRDMFREVLVLDGIGVPTDCMEHEQRMRELGIEVDDEG